MIEEASSAGAIPRATDRKEGYHMSTRSATIIRQEQTIWVRKEDGSYEADGTELAEVARFYRHCDGYPEGHGLHMAHSFATLDCGGMPWFQAYFGPFMTGDGVKGTPFEDWGAPCLEFEPPTATHGDLEYLYAVTKRHGSYPTIAVWEIDWDERYGDVLARQPLFEGTAEEYIAWIEGRR